MTTYAPPATLKPFVLEDIDIIEESEQVDEDVEEYLNVKTAKTYSSLDTLIIGKAGIGGSFVAPFKWGTFREKPACLAKIAFEFSSPTNCCLKEATVEILVMKEKTPNSADGDGHPAIVARAPHTLRGAILTPHTINTSSTFAPNFTAAGGGGSLGSATKGGSFVRQESWYITSLRSNGDGGPPNCKIHWVLTANALQPEGVKHDLSVAIVIEHTKKPFSAIFRFSGTVKRGFLNGAFGKKGDLYQEVHFPVEDSIEALDEIDLDELVKENLRAEPRSQAGI